MENLGCVTYRDELLLLDPSQASQPERQHVFMTIAHETAHMWFGDLVTMRWWNGIWLNEAFATFMGTLATDTLHPEWEVWNGLGPERFIAFALDALESTHPLQFPVASPLDAFSMIDILTYVKGAAVLRMMEQYLGPDTFRRGVSLYLDRHRFANTEGTDLWEALEAVSGQPVRDVMASWVEQGGYPVVTLGWDPSRHQLTLSQSHFRFEGAGSGRWAIPMVLAIGRADGAEEVRTLLLGSEPQVVDLPADTAWVNANRGGWGYYRVVYPAALWDGLTSVVSQLEPLERLTLLDDSWAAVVAGRAPLAHAVRLWRAVSGERDPHLWTVVAQNLYLLDRLALDGEREAVRNLAREVAGPVLAAIGWDADASESPSVGRLRGAIISLLGTVGADAAVQAEARRRFEAAGAGEADVAPDLLTAVARVTAASGGEAEWSAMRGRWQAAATPQDQSRYLNALAGFADPSLVEKTIQLYFADARVQDGPGALLELLMNRRAAPAAWDAVEREWDGLMAKYPPFALMTLTYAFTIVVEDALSDRMGAWLDSHPMPALAVQVAQSRELGAVNHAFARRVRGQLTEQITP